MTKNPLQHSVTFYSDGEKRKQTLESLMQQSAHSIASRMSIWTLSAWTLSVCARSVWIPFVRTLSVCLSVCLFGPYLSGPCLSVEEGPTSRLSALELAKQKCVCVCALMCVRDCVFVGLCVCLSVSLSVGWHSAIFPSQFQVGCPFVCPSVCLSVRPSVCLSVLV